MYVSKLNWMDSRLNFVDKNDHSTIKFNQNYNIIVQILVKVPIELNSDWVLF